MKKKKIIHVIDGMARGGAETLLVDILPGLSHEYDITLVTLTPALEFEPGAIICKEYIKLDFKGPRNLFATISQLKKIIARVQPDLVRTQLFWSTIAGRMACPRHIPLFFSVHTMVNDTPIAWRSKAFIYIFEKWTYRRSQKMIGVSNAVIAGFQRVHGSAGPAFLLRNYVRDEFFSRNYLETYAPGRVLKIVAVSNLKKVKNIPYLLEAMRLLKDKPVSLAIIGEGSLREEAESYIKEHELNIELKGKLKEVAGELEKYDLLVSPSLVEGFGIAVAEAMSVGLPVVVSDLPVYREICGDKALFINNKDVSTFVNTVNDIINGSLSLVEMSKAVHEHAVTHFSKKGYLEKLQNIYDSV